MNEKEWDEFAEEYYEIQQESQVTIAEDVKKLSENGESPAC